MDEPGLFSIETLGLLVVCLLLLLYVFGFFRGKRGPVVVVNPYGAINPAMVCPHCLTPGSVRTTVATRKVGISGAKATAALFTLGWSMVATGLSRKAQLTQAHCDHCGNTWDF